MKIVKDIIEIVQDDREPELQIMAFMVESNMVLKRKRLKIGDYAFGNLIIERKSIDDFCASILDGRLETQTKKMQEAQTQGKRCVVILVGRMGERKTVIHEHCILGKICSLVYKHRIDVLMVDNDYQFLYCLKNLYEKAVK